MKEYLCPFLKVFDLSHLRFGYGVGKRRYSFSDHRWYTSPRAHNFSPRVFEAELELLNNLPGSLVSLELMMPRRFRNGDRATDVSVRNLVSALCRLQANGEQNRLQTLSMKGFQLERAYREYLIFMFGHNNKLHITARGEYSMKFND